MRLSGPVYWKRIARFIETGVQPRGPMVQVEPTFRFGVITADPDDNKFVDCAVVAQAGYIITEDRHFTALINSGYRPQPITPQAFIDKYLMP